MKLQMKRDILLKDRKTCETDAGQNSMYSHVTTLTTTFNLHDKLFHNEFATNFQQCFLQQKFFSLLENWL